jgi:metal-sulfur cluster biosynthetic enzyme
MSALTTWPGMAAVRQQNVSEEAVIDTLRCVNDPELDESLVDLGFVERVRVDGSAVEVVLRLPTFWCAPNFAYLMAHDAREQLRRLPGVAQVRVILMDHMYADEISVGVSDCRSFNEIFPGQAESNELDDLRELFRRKAFGMRQEQFVRFLLDEGLSAEHIVGLSREEVLDTSDRSGLRLRIGGQPRHLRGGAPLARAYLDRRARLRTDSDCRDGREHGSSARLITDADGNPITADGLHAYLQRVRRERISMTFNALMCRGLLETRYDLKEVRE